MIAHLRELVAKCKPGEKYGESFNPELLRFYLLVMCIKNVLIILMVGIMNGLPM